MTRPQRQYFIKSTRASNKWVCGNIVNWVPLLEAIDDGEDGYVSGKMFPTLKINSILLLLNRIQMMMFKWVNQWE